jgi:hypothetical protein
VAGDKLSNYDELMNIGSGLTLPTNIKMTQSSLGKKVFK